MWALRIFCFYSISVNRIRTGLQQKRPHCYGLFFPVFVSIYAILYKFVTAFRTEFSVRNYFCSTGWAEIQLFLRLLVIAARRLRIQYKLNDYPFRPAPSGKIISSVIDNLLNCINQGGNASVFLFSLKKVIDIGNRKSELSADIIQPEPPLKLRLNYYKRLFLSCLTM